MVNDMFPLHAMPDGPSSKNLSPRARSIWAKTNMRDPTNDSYLLLWQHLADTAAVASYVWHDLLPQHVTAMIADGFGVSFDDAAIIFRFIAGVHDVGKASPAFAMQNLVLAERSAKFDLNISTGFLNTRARSAVRHELVGDLALRTWLRQHTTISIEVATSLSGVVGGHHGTCTTDAKLQFPDEYPDLFGTGLWADTRAELISWMADQTGVLPVLSRLQSRHIPKPTPVLITAALILADWIASNDELFPLNASAADEVTFDAEARAAAAWRQLGLPKPWHAITTSESLPDRFAHRFALPGAQPRPTQRDAVVAAETMQQPGLMIIESPMGEGKTEAALLAAEILAAHFGLNGVYWALPTQATANAMFPRQTDWVQHLPADHPDTVASVELVHGKRDLNPNFTNLYRRRPAQSLASDAPENEQSELVAIAHNWFSGRKRANLASFVVGTFDQVLMAGLKSKHVVLRHLALAGKVVILDEVHAVDTFMNVYLETVLSWLAAENIPVILLSATLPATRRQALVSAYRAGLPPAGPDVPASSDDADDDEDELFPSPESVRTREAKRRARQRDVPGLDPGDLSYPLITVEDGAAAVHSYRPEPSGRSTRIQTVAIDDSDETLIDTLQQLLRDGGSAAIIRNTVRRAQHTFAFLQAAFPKSAEITLAHSRFLAFDRARIDADLVDRFGPGADRRGTRIVVGTQVMEQSLDVDFDVMFTDLAPVDLVLQRAGRLHRHHNARPIPLSDAQLFLTGVDWDTEVPNPDRGSTAVYGKYLLLRSLAALDVSPEHPRNIDLPADIAPLVQAAYHDGPLGPGEWQDEMTAAQTTWQKNQHDRETVAQLYRIAPPQDQTVPVTLRNWLDQATPDPDSARGHSGRASVRDGEDSVEVFALCRDADGQLVLPPWGDWTAAERAPLPAGFGTPSWVQARAILTCSIALSRAAIGIHNLDLDALILGLEQQDRDIIPQDWIERSPELGGQLFIILDHDGMSEVPLILRSGPRTWRFRYLPETGLETIAS
jgi:CRISPR-associated endonuclease/helicase Cas3